MTDITEAHLKHFGVKGMKWGHRKSESTSEKTPRTSEEKKVIAKKVAIGTGVLIAAGGAAYLGYQLKQNGSLKVSEILVSSDVKKKVDDLVKEPMGVIHSSRGRNDGFKFYADGQIPDPLPHYLKYFGDRDESQIFDRDNGKIAARFLDPEGRVDRAGRTIPHEVIIPKTMTEGINSIDDVVTKIWPTLKPHYDDNYENRADGSKA